MILCGVNYYVSVSVFIATFVVWIARTHLRKIGAVNTFYRLLKNCTPTADATPGLSSLASASFTLYPVAALRSKDRFTHAAWFHATIILLGSHHVKFTT